MAVSIVHWKPEIGRGLKSYSQLKYTSSVSLSQPRQMGLFYFIFFIFLNFFLLEL